MNCQEFAQKYAATARLQRKQNMTVFRTAKDKASRLYDQLHNVTELAKDRQAVQELIDYKIPGFFPTPGELAQKVISWADIKPGHKVLEPSAGGGHIAELVPKDADLTCVEYNYTLAQVLVKKGFKVVNMDFLTWKPDFKFDRIVMNPPFERRQDIAHVKHAFDLLSAGGILVSIVSAGAFYANSRRIEQEFQSWLDEHCTAQEVLSDAFACAMRPTKVKIALAKLVKIN